MDFKSERRALKRLFMYVSPNLKLTYNQVCKYLERVSNGTETAIVLPEPTYSEQADVYIANWVHDNQKKAKARPLKVGRVDEDGYIQRVVDFANITVLVLDKDDQLGARINEYCISKNACYKVYKPIMVVQHEEEKNTN